jgi:hypothetical protein
VTPATCGNCNAPLTGPYCAQCGQHAHESARSLGALFHDAWHVVTHLDGRFWSTLRLLLLRPGQLTLEYFAERRARYVPPVRLYFVISIAFFITFFGLSSPTRHGAPAAAATGSGAQQPLAAELGGIKAEIKQAAREAQQAARKEGAKAAPDGAGKDSPGDAADDGDGVLNFDFKDCDKMQSGIPGLQQLLRDACRRGLADHGAALKHAFVANIPKMMFVFLPLIALVMRLLYWFPRRYYVEHLVLVVHNHAALFLAMTLLSLFGAVARLVPALDGAVAFGAFAVFGYAVWYVYRSTRRYYGQGRWLTLAKLSLVGLCYLVFLAITLLGTFVVSALIA